MFTVVRLAAPALTDDIYMLGLAEEADGSGRGLIFQEPIDQDLIDQTDTYCVTDESHAVMYGGVRDVTLRDSELTNVLDPDLSSEAGFPSQFVLELQIPSADRSQVADALRRVLLFGREDEHPRLNF